MEGIQTKRTPRKPADRPVFRVTYFPGEAARILGLEKIDYRQLRRLFAMIEPAHHQIAKANGKAWTWARYSFRQLVALKTALRLAGVTDGARLDIAVLERVCATLRGSFQRENPLTDTQLERLGETIIARLGGKIFDAETGQRLIDEVAGNVKTFVRTNCHADERAACLKQVRDESRELLAVRRLNARRPERTGIVGPVRRGGS